MIDNPRNALVVGNGFDLDLELDTRFSDFAKSTEFWPKRDGSKLSAYLEKKKEVNDWFDLEGALLHYALSNVMGEEYATKPDEIKADLEYFEKMRVGLMGYLSQEQSKPINKTSTAARLLSAISDNSCFKYIYTLNYTDINKFADIVGVKYLGDPKYLHGSLTNKDIIIGVNHSHLRDGYKNWRKTRSVHYRSHNFFADLDAAKEVIFFGVSFGIIDYKYFDQFFKKVSARTDEPVKEVDRKSITIFTFSEKDRTAILDFLVAMKVDLEYLFSQTNFNIIRTQDGIDEKKVEECLTRLRNSKPMSYPFPNGSI